MKRAYVLMAVVGLMAWSASAAEINLEAWFADCNGTTGVVTPTAPLPIGPYGNPTIFQQNPPPGEYCPPETINIVLMISTDRTDTGVAGMDLQDPGTTLDGLGNPSGVWMGDWDDPDPYIILGQQHAFGSIQVDEQDAAVQWHFTAGSGYDLCQDTWFFNPYSSQIGVGYEEDPAGKYYLASAVGQPLGQCDPTVGADGNLVPFLNLVIDKSEIPCGDRTWVSIAGLPGLCSGERPLDFMWLNTYFSGLDPVTKEVPLGYIDIICTPEPASLALMGLGVLPVILRRRG